MTHHRFAAWVRSGKKTKAEVAKALDVNLSTVWRYMAGERKPGLETAFKIQELTRGAIKAQDWNRSRAA